MSKWPFQYLTNPEEILPILLEKILAIKLERMITVARQRTKYINVVYLASDQSISPVR